MRRCRIPCVITPGCGCVAVAQRYVFCVETEYISIVSKCILQFLYGSIVILYIVILIECIIVCACMSVYMCVCENIRALNVIVIDLFLSVILLYIFFAKIFKSCRFAIVKRPGLV